MLKKVQAQTRPVVLNVQRRGLKLFGVELFGQTEKIKLPTTPGRYVFTWGSGENGRLGSGKQDMQVLPTFVNQFSSSPVVQLAVGGQHTLALTENGEIYAWGENSSSQLGLGDTTDVFHPTLIKALADKKVVCISTNNYHSAAIDDEGNVYTWGGVSKNISVTNINRTSGLGLGSEQFVKQPTLVSALKGVRIKQVSCGESHTGAVSEAGDLYTWGKGAWGRLGHGNFETYLTPKKNEQLQEKAKKISLGSNFSAVLSETGKLYMFGKNDNGHLGMETAATLLGGAQFDGVHYPSRLTFEEEPDLRVRDISCGTQFVLCVTEKGDCWAWGKHYPRPTKIKRFQGAAAVHAGSKHCSIITEDRSTLHMMGTNSQGQLGNGEFNSSIFASAQELNTIDQKKMPGAKFIASGCGDGFSIAVAEISSEKI